MMQRTLALALLLVLSNSMVTTAQENAPAETTPPLPLSNSPSTNYVSKPLTFAQQTARFEAEQRILRLQWNKWIGHDPLRPTMNASYMSNGVHRFYIPQRAAIVSPSAMRSWYW
ncbi:MAG: hypothetical protein ACE361_04965 [Aureliella sp.]